MRAVAMIAAAAVACAAGAAGARAAPPDDGVLIRGRSLGGIAIGSTRADVTRAWGRSYGRCLSCRAETLYFNRVAFAAEGAGVELDRGRVVAVFTIWAPPGWRTDRGLRIGEPELRLAATYGPLAHVPCAGYDAVVVPGSGARSVVYVLDGEVWGFALLVRGHPICR